MLFAILALAGGLEWQSYTSTNYINDIVGSDTLLILATRGGVYELDIRLDTSPGGLSDTAGFRVLRAVTNSEGLPANVCNALVLDPEGNIWVATEGGGLGVILRAGAEGPGRRAEGAEEKEFFPLSSGRRAAGFRARSARAQSYRAPSAMPEIPETITSIDRDGTRLLLGTYRGLYIIETHGTWLDYEDDVIHRYSVAGRPELLSDRVYSVAVLADRYWVGTNVGVTGVDRNFGDWRAWRRPLGDSVKSIAAWRDTVLVATEWGVARLEDSVFRPVFRFDAPRRVFDLEPAAPNLYVATDTGVFTLQNLDSTTLRQFTGRECRTVYRGRGIWIGRGGALDQGEGLRYLLPGRSWETFMTDGIVSAMVTGVAFSPVNSDLYACHYRSSRAVSVIAPETRAVAVVPGALTLPLQIACDSRGRVWCAHFSDIGGLSCYDPVAEKWDTIQWGPRSGWNIITAFGIDHNDTKWMFNADGVVVAIDSAGRETSFDTGLAPPPGGAYDFAADRRGRAWLGLTVGLVMIDYGGTLHDLSDDRYAVLTEGLPSREVRSVAVDAHDNVWVGTSQGAAVYDGERFRVYNTVNTDRGLPSNDVYRVRVDRSERVWLLTDIGLTVFDPLAPADRRWTSFTPQRSGLIANTEGVTGFYTSLELDAVHGRVAVGTLRGLSVLKLSTDPGPVDLTALRIYPNPCILGSYDIDRVYISDFPRKTTGIEIRTLSGRLVARPEVDTDLHRSVWYPSDIASGIYLVVVKGEYGTHVGRVAVVRP